MFISANSNAEEKNSDDINPFLAVGLFEGMIAVNAWLASEDPVFYGVVVALFTPVAAAKSKNMTTSWVSLAAGEAIALYNISLDGDHYSNSEIFNKNMIGWHLFAGVIGLSMWLSEDGANDKNVTFGIAPTGGGGELMIGYRF